LTTQLWQTGSSPLAWGVAAQLKEMSPEEIQTIASKMFE
jgi:hypothetical protein